MSQEPTLVGLEYETWFPLIDAVEWRNEFRRGRQPAQRATSIFSRGSGDTESVTPISDTHGANPPHLILRKTFHRNFTALR